MGLLDRLRAAPAPAPSTPRPATSSHQCQAGIVDSSGLTRCPNAAPIMVPVHPDREVLVCEAHYDLERIRCALYVQTRSRRDRDRDRARVLRPLRCNALSTV